MSPRVRVAVAFAPLVLCGAAFLGLNMLEKREDPNEILDKAIEAHGGDRIRALFKSRIRSTVQKKGRAEEVFDLPRRSIQTATDDQGDTLTYLVVDGVRWTKKNTQPAVQSDEPVSSGTLLLCALLGIRKAHLPLTYDGTKTINGRRAVGFRVDLPMGVAYYYFDKKTRLLVSYREHNHKQDSEMILDEYRDYHGLMYPMRLRTTLAGHNFAATVNVTDVEFLETVPDSEFAFNSLETEEPNEILKKAIEAHGGEDRISRLRVAYTWGTMTLVNGPKPTPVKDDDVNVFAEVIEWPKRYKRTMIAGDDNFSYPYIDGQDWNQKNQQKTREKREGEAGEAPPFPTILLLGLLPTDHKAIFYAGKERVNGRSTVGVRIHFRSGLISHWYFDEKSRLLARYDGRLNTHVAELLIEKYQNLEGLQYPAKMIIVSDKKKTNFYVIKIEFRDAISDREFE